MWDMQLESSNEHTSWEPEEYSGCVGEGTHLLVCVIRLVNRV